MNLTTSIEQFTVNQKMTLMVNRYEIRSVPEDGRPDRLLAFAQQKRAAFKEEVTFYEDESRATPLFSFTARQRLDLGATYDVTDAQGRSLGSFRKDFGASLTRSTWHLDAHGVLATGTERNAGVAIARRLWGLVPVLDAVPAPFRFHFDFTTPSGEIVMTSERGASLQDSYLVSLPGARIDGRVAAAMAVALDALQSR